MDDMIELAIFLKARGYRPRQVQDFIPALRALKIGDTVELTVVRGEATIKLPR